MASAMASPWMAAAVAPSSREGTRSTSKPPAKALSAKPAESTAKPAPMSPEGIPFSSQNPARCTRKPATAKFDSK